MPSSIAKGRIATGLSRRAFVKSSSLGAAGLAVAAAGVDDAPALADPPHYDAGAMAAQISAKLFADDGLARPAPDKPTVSDLARGLDRTLVLGGGGEYYVAWYCGFFHGLDEQKVDLDMAEMVVGTSAGAYAGSTLTSGHFGHLRRVFDFFGEFPGLFAKLAPVTSPNLSQKRAQEINFNVKDGAPGIHSRHRPRSPGGGQSRQRRWRRSPRLVADRRQPHRLARCQDVDDGKRLLHGRTIDRQLRPRRARTEFRWLTPLPPAPLCPA